MAKPPTAISIHEGNLKFVVDNFCSVEWFIFFGTLLGYVREGSILKNDDDIDIYINVRDQQRVKDILNKNSLEITKQNEHFIQVKRQSDGGYGFIDLYFFNGSLNNHIIERHNFFGIIDKKHYQLKIRKDWIYPIKVKEYQNFKINVPFQEQRIVKFLYGKRWSQPMKKNTKDYRITMLFNRPLVLYGKAAVLRAKLGHIYHFIMRT